MDTLMYSGLFVFASLMWLMVGEPIIRAILGYVKEEHHDS